MYKRLKITLNAFTSICAIISFAGLIYPLKPAALAPSYSLAKQAHKPKGYSIEDVLSFNGHGHKRPTEQEQKIDPDSLKTTSWYNTITAEISRRSYHILPSKNNKANSVNAQQGLRTEYCSNGFTIKDLKQPDLAIKGTTAQDSHWELPLTIEGLYEDGKLYCMPETKASAKLDSSGLSYSYQNKMEVHYQNTPDGVRQNFIIAKKTSSNTRELRVALSAGKGWKAQGIGGKEVQFTHQHKNRHTTKINYSDLNVWDANGKRLLAYLEAKDRKVSIVVDVKEAAFPVTIDPLSTPSTSLSGSLPNGQFGYSVASAGDINGDGYGDVIIGTYVATTDTGKAYVYLGSSNGLSTTIAVTLSGTAVNDDFGISVASAGDVNGDGFSDVIVGAPGISSHKGAAYVYLGSPSGLSATAGLTLSGFTQEDRFGFSVSGAGDVNGDGYSDVIVGAYEVTTSFFEGAAYVYYGSSVGLAQSPSKTLPGSTSAYFGFSVACAGDVNGDGFSDVVIGAPFVATSGAAYVYLGNASGLSSTPVVTLSIGAESAHYGWSVAGAGDVNGDGYSDVVVGAYASSSFTGSAFIYTGGPAGTSASPATLLQGTVKGYYFGVSVAGAGDVNGDGYSDVVIGAYYSIQNVGSAFVFLGSRSGLSTTPSVSLLSTPTIVKAGGFVSNGGDINGDGYSEIIVGEYAASSNTGAAYIFQGSAGSLADPATAMINGGSTNSYLGYSVAGAGDINGDGYNDVIVGAYGAYSNPGAAYVYLGSASGLSLTPAVTLHGNSTNGEFGQSVAAAGDVNGDGYADVIVGEYAVSGNKGDAYLYLGGPSGLSTTAATVLNGSSSNSYFSYKSVACAGDVNGDGYSDVIVGAYGSSANAGAAYLFLGGPNGLSASAATVLNGPANSYFGLSVACAGDVNGDGYSDVVVGASAASSGPGTAYIYLGGPNGLTNMASNVLTGEAQLSNFGYSVSGAGDINGDGYSDVIIGAYNLNANSGAAYLYLGSSTGLTSAAVTILNGSTNSLFGISVAGAGDVNGDGYSDVAVGAFGVSSQTGAAYIYLGGPTGLSATAADTLNGISTLSDFGFSVTGAGDVNGDGYGDVMVGAYAASSNTGAAYLYAGNTGYNIHNNNLRLYTTDLSTPINSTNFSAAQFGVGLFVRPLTGTTKGRLVWETEPNGTGFKHNSPMTNYTGYTGAQAAYTNINPAGAELKALIAKTGSLTKIRVRVQYQSASLPGGQKFGPWIYPQTYLGPVQSGIVYTSGQVLPISLLGFSANKNGVGNLLDWHTSSEDMGTIFDIERSTDGPVFDKIGSINGRGYTAAYTFYDERPTAGIDFYRLKIINADGTFIYSKIVPVDRSSSANGIMVGPVPAKNMIMVINPDAALNGKVVSIVDIAGRRIFQFTLRPTNNIDISMWAKGSYYILFPSGNTSKIVKQ